MDGVFGISNIIAILAPTNAKSRNQPPHQLNTTIFEDSGLNPFYNNLWYKGFFLPRQIGSSLQFQAKEKPAGGEGVAEIEEVGESGTIGARFEGWLWSILEL